jgi:enoyl-CoA hydratase/3-hydroxyacyl-CoA dehydrogenase
MVDISQIKSVAVIGPGFMGHGIAQVCLMAGFEKVILNDISIQVLNKAEQQIEASLKKSEAKGLFNDGITTELLMDKLVKKVDLTSAVANADFVFEAVPETTIIKQEVYKKLGEYSPEHTVIASNTSTMSITKLGEMSGIPERVIGMHFFFPIIRQSCVEVMKGEKSSENAFEIGLSIGETLPCSKGKRLVVRIEKESLGFIANRLLIPPSIYLNWVFDQAHEKGIPWEQIDADARSGHLVPMGPCEQMDYAGLDTIYNAMKSYEESVSPDFAPGRVLSKLISEGNLGSKTGKGFYNWTEGRPKLNLSKKAGLYEVEIQMAIMLNEGCKLLEEGTVSGYKIIDEIMLKGLNIPGVFASGRRNYEKWSKILENLADKIGKSYLKPCELMKTGGFLKMRK